jgi:hypothetical protein
MTLADLQQAINECNNGLLVFNLGNNRSFLYNKKWYPLRALVNRARALNGENEVTTDRALLNLSITLDYVRIDEVSFLNNLPVDLNQDEVMIELNNVVSILKSLTE